MFTKTISKKGFLFPVLTLAGLLSVAPPVFSQTQGMERRDDRREGRGERQEGRQEAKDARQEGR